MVKHIIFIPKMIAKFQTKYLLQNIKFSETKLFQKEYFFKNIFQKPKL